MLVVFKKKKVFEGSYWTTDWDLEPFKLRARSEAEAREKLAKMKDFRLVCVIEKVKSSCKEREYSELYLRASKKVRNHLLSILLVIFCGFCIAAFFCFLDNRIKL